MKAAFYDTFQGPITIESLQDPAPKKGEVVIQVKSTGLCRSDWHGWMGHDGDIHLPHVPGHEFAGVIVELGAGVKNWSVGDRVTAPFCLGCGSCESCNNGDHQVCYHYEQPGFTYWGSFAEYVKVPFADVNLVQLPDSMDFQEAAVIGCRFMTAYRGVVHQGKIKPGQYLVVLGCGGVGLSTIMIGAAMGAYVIAVDIDPQKLVLAKQMGASETILNHPDKNLPEFIKTLTNGGCHVAVDALGSTSTCVDGILSLRKRGKHIQIGLMAGQHKTPSLPMGPVIANELEIIGSHGMQAYVYPEMLRFILSQQIPLKTMIGQSISLDQVPIALPQMNQFSSVGIQVINF